MKNKRRIRVWLNAIEKLVIASICFTMLIPVDSLTPVFDSTKTYTYLDQNGQTRLCLECPPGMFRTRHCTSKDTVDHCDDCHTGFFKWSYDQATSCQRCKAHCYDRNEIKVGNCNGTQDIVCECKAGFYKHMLNCSPHIACPTGQGVAKNGTKDTDTECGGCVSGRTYSDVNSETEPCQNCIKPPCNLPHSTISDCTIYHNYACTNNTVSDAHNSATPGLSTSQIILIVIVIVVLVGILIVIIYCVWKRSRSNQNMEGSHENRDPAGSALLRVDIERNIFHCIESGIDVNSWKSFIRGLEGNFVTDTEIDRIEHNHNKPINEQIHEALRKYAEKNPDINPNVYVVGLRKFNQNSLADKVEDILQNGPPIVLQNGRGADQVDDDVEVNDSTV